MINNKNQITNKFKRIENTQDPLDPLIE